MQLTGRREGDCNGASSVIFPCAAAESITEPASVASCRGSEIRFFREDTVKFDGLRFDENLSRQPYFLILYILSIEYISISHTNPYHLSRQNVPGEITDF